MLWIRGSKNNNISNCGFVEKKWKDMRGKKLQQNNISQAETFEKDVFFIIIFVLVLQQQKGTVKHFFSLATAMAFGIF